MTRTALMLIFFVLCNTGGEIAMSYGVKQVGEPQSFRPMALLRFVWAAVKNRWLWVAIPLLAASFYSLLILFSWAPVSVVIPGFGFELHCGYVWREVSVEGRCFLQAVDGRRDGMPGCDAGFVDWERLRVWTFFPARSNPADNLKLEEAGIKATATFCRAIAWKFVFFGAYGRLEST